jgi:hypothetical protein
MRVSLVTGNPRLSASTSIEAPAAVSDATAAWRRVGVSGGPTFNRLAPAPTCSRHSLHPANELSLADVLQVACAHHRCLHRYAPIVSDLLQRTEIVSTPPRVARFGAAASAEAGHIDHPHVSGDTLGGRPNNRAVTFPLSEAMGPSTGGRATAVATIDTANRMKPRQLRASRTSSTDQYPNAGDPPAVGGSA